MVVGAESPKVGLEAAHVGIDDIFECFSKLLGYNDYLNLSTSLDPKDISL